MKKNVMMRLASFLLIAVLISTSAISGTYAKYVSADSATDSARVAKWGVEFVTNDTGLFKPQYNYQTVPNGVSAEYSVEADVDVVAPGTSGSGYNFTTNHPMGDPEVSYEVSFKVQGTAETVYVDDYYPIKYTLILGTTEVVKDSNNLHDVMAKLELCKYMFDVDNKQYYISTDNGTTWTAYAGVPSLDLSWKWDFSIDSATDVLDTKLGNLAAGYALSQVDATKANLTVAFTINATATQID